MSRLRVVQAGTTAGRSDEIQVRREFRDGNRVDAFLTEPDSFVGRVSRRCKSGGFSHPGRGRGRITGRA
jgi:hypothetical protein